MVHENGTKNDKFHRDDGPAIIYSDCSQEWYQNGKLHRDDGPAIIYSDGTRCWFRHGNTHDVID